jgi:ribosomal-protein-alanine N-acetyltransferase
MDFRNLMPLRAATAADIPLLIELERECPTAAHWGEEQYAELFRTGGSERLVVGVPAALTGKDETGLLGFLVARHVAPEWELENIVVAPAARRQGVGQRLLGALLTKARETGSRELFLEVRESNAAARGLYEKAGFKEAGRRKSYYANPLEDAVLYRRKIP